MTSDPRTLRISNMGNSASPLGSLDYSRCCHVTFCGSESSVNLDASCRYPTILLRITHYLQEVVRRLGLNPLGEKLQELLFCASAIDSSQCCEDHGPRGENVLCRRVLTGRYLIQLRVRATVKECRQDGRRTNFSETEICLRCRKGFWIARIC